MAEDQAKTLRDVKIGDTATVRRLTGEGALKRHIMDMGITKEMCIRDSRGFACPRSRCGLSNVAVLHEKWRCVVSSLRQENCLDARWTIVSRCREAGDAKRSRHNARRACLSFCHFGAHFRGFAVCGVSVACGGALCAGSFCRCAAGFVDSRY